MFIVIWLGFHRGTIGALLIVGAALLATPGETLAQHGGGGPAPAGVSAGAGAPSGVSEKDELKNFHRAMAMQATAEQRTAFAKVAQYAQAAGDQLREFRKSLQQGSASATDGAIALDRVLEKARTSSQNFVASFSSVQKSGLQDSVKKVGRADAELDRQIKALDQIVHAPKPEIEAISNSAAALDKALDSFQSEQLALGREMSIFFDAAGQGVTFGLPMVTNSINVAGQTISVPASGMVARTSAGTLGENGRKLFNLKLVANLSDVQQNIRGILGFQLTRSPRCGERIEVQQATFTPLIPAGLVVADLHIERWVCAPGQQSPMEVTDGDATFGVKLTPSLDAKGGLALASEITRVQAEGLLRNLLRSGDLGVTLREEIAASVLSALQKGADLKTVLPPVAQQSAMLQKAQFQDDGADQLSLVLDGQLQFSDEQTQQFAAQLKQRLAAQGTTPQ